MMKQMHWGMRHFCAWPITTNLLFGHASVALGRLYRALGAHRCNVHQLLGHHMWYPHCHPPSVETAAGQTMY